MKAKVKATGEIVDVYERYNDFAGEVRWEELYVTYSADELDFDVPQDTPQEVTIEGWVTRSKNGKIVFSDSPECKRGSCVWYHKEGSNIVTLSETGLFDEGILPSVTWESGPQKVKITITPVYE